MKGIKRLLVGMVALCFGLLFFFMYISTVWVLGVSPFLELRHNYALADRLRETEPTSWETLPSRDHTGTVLLQGHPSQYLSESSSLRTNGLYDTDQIDKPDFDLRDPPHRCGLPTAASASSTVCSASSGTSGTR